MSNIFRPWKETTSDIKQIEEHEGSSNHELSKNKEIKRKASLNSLDLTNASTSRRIPFAPEEKQMFRFEQNTHSNMQSTYYLPRYGLQQINEITQCPINDTINIISSMDNQNLNIAGSSLDFLRYRHFTGGDSTFYVPNHIGNYLESGTNYPSGHSGFHLGINSGIVARTNSLLFPPGLYPASIYQAMQNMQQQEDIAKEKKKRPKKLPCEYCNLKFSNNGQLKGHVRSHTGERPFKCEVPSCNKSFTRNEELTRHRRIHTGIRPHSCEICAKSFGRKDHLKKHLKTHKPHFPPVPINVIDLNEDLARIFPDSNFLSYVSQR